MPYLSENTLRKKNLYVISHLSLADGGSLARRTAAELLINVYVF